MTQQRDKTKQSRELGPQDELNLNDRSFGHVIRGGFVQEPLRFFLNIEFAV